MYVAVCSLSSSAAVVLVLHEDQLKLASPYELAEEVSKIVEVCSCITGAFFREVR